MFIGHYAVALASKKAAPRVSLGTLFLSVQLLDLLWPLFLLLGIEHVRIEPGNTAFTPLDFYDYPISHSLFTVLGWSLGFSVIYYFARHYQRGCWILGVGVLSHWVLDFITHRPDMPISPGVSVYVGLGLWDSVIGTIIVEGALFVAGVVVYARTTVAGDRTGRYAFWSLICFFVLVYVGNILSPPPHSETALAFAGLTLWLIVPWGYWIDRHRQPVVSYQSSCGERDN
ncbi:MAG: hypothetical protein HY277_07725 [Ignavibacteriales bacterium]|nr:hypothetical protein [Ignavibacteriales bacterium]